MLKPWIESCKSSLLKSFNCCSFMRIYCNFVFPFCIDLRPVLCHYFAGISLMVRIALFEMNHLFKTIHKLQLFSSFNLYGSIAIVFLWFWVLYFSIWGYSSMACNFGSTTLLLKPLFASSCFLRLLTGISQAVRMVSCEMKPYFKTVHMLSFCTGYIRYHFAISFADLLLWFWCHFHIIFTWFWPSFHTIFICAWLAVWYHFTLILYSFRPVLSQLYWQVYVEKFVQPFRHESIN